MISYSQIKSLERDSSVQLELPAALAYSKLDGALGASPSLAGGVPDREIVTRQGYCDGLALARIEQDIREALQDRGRFACRRRMLKIELGNLHSKFHQYSYRLTMSTK